MARRLDAVDAAAGDCDAVDAAAREPTRPAQVSHNQLKVMAPCKIAQSADQDKQEGIGEPDLNGCDWSKLESLATLDVSHNELEKLPDDLAKMTALTEIDCRSNLLTELPQALELMNCTSFY